VTTEQELKLALVTVVVDAAVLDELAAAVVAADALVVDVVLDDVGEDELHAARRMATGMATTIPRTPGRSLT